jgi:hypothetical protein
MANTNKVAFAVSVTPKVVIDEVDNTHGDITVLHESVRKTVGGNGEITANSGDVTVNGDWNEGVNTAVTSNGSEIPVDTGTDMVFFKHTGLLFGGSTSSAAADTLKITIHGDDTSNVTGDGVIIAELANGEAMLIPRPASTLTWKLVTGNGSNHVGVEVLVLST